MTDTAIGPASQEGKSASSSKIFSFNSPVWSNVGTSPPKQVSACQPYDALVSTPAGMIPIGRLVADNAVGAKVHDAHGTTRIVSGRAKGVKEVLRLHTTAGLVLDVTPDHLVWRAADLEVGEFTVAGFLRPGDRLLHVDPDVGGSDRRMVEVRKVERRGDMEVYDIQTDSGEYLSGNLRVHDCSLLAAATHASQAMSPSAIRPHCDHRQDAVPDAGDRGTEDTGLTAD